MDRRLFLRLGASMGIAAGLTAWASGRRRHAPATTLPSGEPILRMPFHAGTAVLCQQGNAQRHPRTHSHPNCWHALDFSNEALERIEVVAPAPGRITHAIADAALGDPDAGLGFGNQVKIDHGDGWFTFHAHLDEVWIEPGAEVDVGTPIGTMGNTGAAGNRHLHFSLHRSDPLAVGVHDTVEMHALVVADLTDSGTFRRRSSTELRGAPESVWAGRIYGAETSAERPAIEGPPPLELARRLAASREALQHEVDCRRTLERFFDDFDDISTDVVRQRLSTCTPGAAHLLVDFWQAAAVSLPEGSLGDAEARLRRVLAADRRARHWEADLVPWAQLFLGEVRRRQGRNDEALTLLADAAEASPSLRHYLLAQRQLGLLVHAAKGEGAWSVAQHAEGAP